MIKDLARQIAEEKIVPIREELDEKEEFPWEIMTVLAQSDLFGLFISEEYGGLGKGCFELSLAVEELSRACLGVATTYAANALGTYPMILFGNEQQKKTYLPDIAAGKDSSHSDLQKRMQEAMLREFRRQRNLKGMNTS